MWTKQRRKAPRKRKRGKCFQNSRPLPEAARAPGCNGDPAVGFQWLVGPEGRYRGPLGRWRCCLRLVLVLVHCHINQRLKKRVRLHVGFNEKPPCTASATHWKAALIPTATAEPTGAELFVSIKHQRTFRYSGRIRFRLNWTLVSQKSTQLSPLLLKQCM